MKTYKPNKKLLEIPEHERIQWAEWLETTEMEQCQGRMTYGPNTACCLHVWECYKQNGGEWFDTDQYVPSQLEKPSRFSNGKLPQSINFLISNTSTTPDMLNDIFKLTFNEIAQILRGNEIKLNHEK